MDRKGRGHSTSHVLSAREGERERERERDRERERERGKERESAVVVLEIGRHELYMNRVKCFKTLSAFVFHPSKPRTSLKRSCTSRPGMEMLLIRTSLHGGRLDAGIQWRNRDPSAWLTVRAHTIPRC